MSNRSELHPNDDAWVRGCHSPAKTDGEAANVPTSAGEARVLTSRMRQATYATLIAGCVAISFSAIFVKFTHVPPTVSAFFRCFYATLILFVASLLFRRTEFAANNGRWVWPSLLAGLFLAADLIIWHKTIFYIGAGPATVLGNSQVIFMALAGHFVWREKISPWFWLLLPLVFTGLYAAVPKAKILVLPETGFALGLMVGLTYTGYLFCLHAAKRRTPKNYPEILSLSVIMFFSALIIGLYAVFAEQVPLLGGSGQDQAVMFLMALIPQSLGWIWIKRSITRLPSHVGSLWLLLQPVLTTLWGAWFFGEPLASVQILGIVLALGSLAWYQFKLAPRG